MAKTRHIHKRMSQRSIQEGWLDLVKAFGIDDGDRIILNRNGIDCALEKMKKMASELQKLRSRGGLVLVVDGSTEITTYTQNSHNSSYGINK